MGMSYRDRVHPDLLELYDSAPGLELDDFANHLRTFMAEELKENGLPVSDEVEVTEQYICGKNGVKDIYVRIYKPAEISDILPALLWIHGGGYVSGFAKRDESVCILFAKEVKCLIVSVEYHLAPEYPFPVPIEDCYSALQWLYDNSAELNVDTERIAIAGYSAGGGLTAALSMIARDRGGPKVIFQMPLYPMLDDRCDKPSSLEMQDRVAWFGEGNKKAWSLYLTGIDPEDVPPYAAPARATDLSGLPPTYTFIGELDPLRDETIEYVERLGQAGVPVEFHLYPGCFHAFDIAAVRTKIGDRALNGCIEALSFAFEKAR